MIEMRRSSGVVLVVSMIFLLVLSIIGISVMNGSSLELKMAANSLDKTVSFNDAEDVRGAAEAAVNSIVDRLEINNESFAAALTTLGYGNGFYDISAGGTVSTDVFEFWQDSNNYRAVGANGAGYVIEYLGVHAVFLNRNTAWNRGNEALMHVFRLTVMGRGNHGALSAVQAIYMRN